MGTSDSTLAANNPVAPSQHPNAPAAMAAEAVVASDATINSEIEVGFGKTGVVASEGKLIIRDVVIIPQDTSTPG